MAKTAILSVRVEQEFSDDVDTVATFANVKRAEFIEQAVREKMDRARGLHVVRTRVPDSADKHRQEVLDLLRQGPATKFELATALKWEEHWVSPRITELKKMGIVIATGERRLNPGSGTTCAVWRVA